MMDLEERFEALGRTKAPDLWQQIEGRPHSHALVRKPGPARRIVIALVAVVVAVSGIAFAMEAFDRDEHDSGRPIDPEDRIAVIESRVGNGTFPSQSEVVLIDPITGGSTQVTHAAERGWIVRAVAWSPDGRRLAYVMGDPVQNLAFAGTWDLYVANADGSRQRQITVDENIGEIAWSPQGDWIAGTFDQGHGVLRFDPEQGLEGVLAEEEGGPFLSISLSPDGGRLLYTSEAGDADHTDLFVLDINSGKRTRLTTGGRSFGPAWSPDGTMIAYAMASEIDVISATGGPVRHITRCRLPDCVGDFRPSWSPDGSELAFVRQEDGGTSFQTYVVDVDGSDLRRLTSGPFDHESPAWRPNTRPSEDTGMSTVGTVTMHDGIFDLEADGDELWAASEAGVVRLDRSTGEVELRVPLAGALDLAIGKSDVWVTVRNGEGGVTRVDRRSGRIEAEIPLGSAYSVDLYSGVVWITRDAAGGGEVVRLDEGTGQVLGRTATGPNGASWIEATRSGAWLSRCGPRDSLVRLDPMTGAIADVIDIGNPSCWNQIEAAGNTLWLATGPVVTLDDGSRTNEVRVVRMDLATGELTSPPVVVGLSAPFGLGVSAYGVWAYVAGEDQLVRINAGDGAILDRVEVDGGTSEGLPPSIQVSPGLVWMAGDGLLWRVAIS